MQPEGLLSHSRAPTPTSLVMRLNVMFPVQTLASHYFCDKTKVPAFYEALLRDSVRSLVTRLRDR